MIVFLNLFGATGFIEKICNYFFFILFIPYTYRINPGIKNRKKGNEMSPEHEDEENQTFLLKTEGRY